MLITYVTYELNMHCKYYKYQTSNFQRKSISAPQISNSKESSQEELHDSE